MYLMHTYPHKIENGEGEELTFFGVVRHRDGDRMEVEFLAPPDVGTPMHLHHLQEEAITVVAVTNSKTHQNRSWKHKPVLLIQRLRSDSAWNISRLHENN